jgi:hypothetical protein
MGISFNKDNLVTGGGLASDFHGKALDLSFGPYNFPNKDGESMIREDDQGRKAGRDVLTMRVVLQPYTGSGRDPDPSNLPNLNEDGQVVSYYGMGKYGELDLFLPSKDGVEPVDVDGDGEDLWGPYLVYADPELRAQVAKNPGVVPQGAPRLSAGTKMNLFLNAAQDATGKEFDDTLDVYKGVYGRWQLLDMPEYKGKQSGIRMGAKKKEGYKDQYLALVQVVPEPKGGAPGGKAAAGKAAGGTAKKSAANGAAGDGDTGDGPTIKQRVARLITKELAKEDGPVKADVIRNLILEQFEKGKAKSEALGYLDDEAFLDSTKWNYNTAKEVFTPVEE